MKPPRVMVARSVPLPLTDRTSTSRPAKSRARRLIELLPPPGCVSDGSAPTAFERDQPVEIVASRGRSRKKMLHGREVITNVRPVAHAVGGGAFALP